MKFTKFIKKYYILIFILFLALILRLISLNQSFWLDETTSGYVARDFNFGQIIKGFAPGDFHPPFYYLLLRGWGLLFGFSEVALRSLSVVFGIGSVWIIYKIAKEFGLKHPELASLILAASGLHIYFSQEARMYVLASFFVLLSFLFFVKTLKKGRVGDFIGFAVFLGLSTMTHYLTLTMIPVYWLIGVIKKKNFIWWKKFIASHIIMLGFYILWSPLLLKQIKNGLSVSLTTPSWWIVLGKTTFKEILLIPIKFIIGRISFDNKMVYALVIVFSLSIFGYLLFNAIKNLKKSYTFFLWLTIPLVLTIIIGLRLSVFSYFRLLFILPAYYLLAAFAFNYLDKRKKVVFTLLILLINITTSLIYLTNSKFQREDWRGLTNYIRINSSFSSIVLFPASTGTEAFRYYAPDISYTVKNSVAGYNEVWLVRYAQPIFDPTDSTRKSVEEAGYKEVEGKDFNGVGVIRYTKIKSI